MSVPLQDVLRDVLTIVCVLESCVGSSAQLPVGFAILAREIIEVTRPCLRWSCTFVSIGHGIYTRKWVYVRGERSLYRRRVWPPQLLKSKYFKPRAHAGRAGPSVQAGSMGQECTEQHRCV